MFLPENLLCSGPFKLRLFNRRPLWSVAASLCPVFYDEGTNRIDSLKKKGLLWTAGSFSMPQPEQHPDC